MSLTSILRAIDLYECPATRAGRVDIREGLPACRYSRLRQVRFRRERELPGAAVNGKAETSARLPLAWHPLSLPAGLFQPESCERALYPHSSISRSMHTGQQTTVVPGRRSEELELAANVVRAHADGSVECERLGTHIAFPYDVSIDEDSQRGP